MKKKKKKKKEGKKIFKKMQETKIHAIRNFFGGDHLRSTSFAVRDDLRSNLGIICGRGSFAALCRSVTGQMHEKPT